MEAGAYVELKVSDTTTGMPPEVLARAFDPFFSTKGTGKGTGLGLSQVYGNMRQAGGTVRIESREKIGTTVRLYRRRADAIPPSVDAQAVSDVDPAERHATVLIVDDEPDVRRVLVECPHALGYASLEGEDGYAVPGR